MDQKLADALAQMDLIRTPGPSGLNRTGSQDGNQTGSSFGNLERGGSAEQIGGKGNEGGNKALTQTIPRPHEPGIQYGIQGWTSQGVEKWNG